jgi:hypothetical protein
MCTPSKVIGVMNFPSNTFKNSYFLQRSSETRAL